MVQQLVASGALEKREREKNDRTEMIVDVCVKVSFVNQAFIS